MQQRCTKVTWKAGENEPVWWRVTPSCVSCIFELTASGSRNSPSGKPMMQDAPVCMQKSIVCQGLPADHVDCASSLSTRNRASGPHSGDVSVKAQALGPTPFQATELSLQQEEAFPGPGLLSGVPGRASCFWWGRASCEGSLGPSGASWGADGPET